jgi:hypothetical protein
MPASGAGCQYVLGFKTLHDLIPATVGDCLSDEEHNAINGDGLQLTVGVNEAGGLMVWRKADNWTAFTDGFHTWINGPAGVQERLNTERFPWEADYGLVFALKLGDLPPGFIFDASWGGARSNDWLTAKSKDPAAAQAFIQKYGRVSGYVNRFYRPPQADLSEGRVTYSKVEFYSSPDNARGAWADPNWWSAPPTKNAQQISAPTIGDQSIAFMAAVTITNPRGDVAATLYQIDFRVGSAVANVETWTPVSQANVNDTIALARIVAGRLQNR